VATTVLAIDDEPDVLELVEYNLKHDGFQVITARDGPTGLDAARRKKPDAILLDVMLPGLDGIEVCRQLKSNEATSSIPVIMLSARGEESDVVVGLAVGAEDYVSKPFRPRELTARIRAALRRARRSRETQQPAAVLRVGELSIDPSRVEARVGETRVPLTLTEFHILHLLAGQPGRVYTRQQILDRIVGEDSGLLERNVDVHVRGIRKKLGEAANLVETIRGVGYRVVDEEG
jgi:DNA-binding response OmpR family regulator